jgi:hypothetical protein
MKTEELQFSVTVRASNGRKFMNDTEYSNTDRKVLLMSRLKCSGSCI